MNLQTAPYLDQALIWPRAGRHILAHHDTDSIVVYQAYKRSMADYAMMHGRFGADNYSYSRMTWIKPNFLWMMYRSGWATKEGQDAVLGLRLSRQFFDHLLAEAVPSTFNPDSYSSHAEWETSVARSAVRLQWDPDHTPTGAKTERRAIQIGIRGHLLEEFGMRQLLEVIDMTPFVFSQRVHAVPSEHTRLLLPLERVYIPEEVNIEVMFLKAVLLFS